MPSDIRKLLPWVQVIALALTIGGGSYVAIYKAPSDWQRWVWAIVLALLVSVVLIVLLFRRYQAARKSGRLSFLNGVAHEKLKAEQKSLDDRLMALEAALRERASAESRRVSILKALLARDFEFCELMQNGGSALSKSELEFEAKLYMKEVLGQISNILTGYTGHHTSVCIKYFLPANLQSTSGKGAIALRPNHVPADPNCIMTLSRDSGSKHRESQVAGVKEPYSYTQNSAFFAIMHGKTKNDGYFFGNSLRNDEGYENGNSNWREHYDSVAVSALHNPSLLKLNGMIGFLCADNKGGGFDSDICRLILECCSSILYYSIQTVLVAYYSKFLDEENTNGQSA